MSDSTCAVPECTIPIKRGGYCYGHYMKNWRYGTPAPVWPSKVEDIRGQRFGSLVVIEREGMAWSCLCDCGASTLALAGGLNRGSSISCGDRFTHARRADSGYRAAHDRCRADRGTAASHSCADCGAPARYWSYNHDDPNEMTSNVPRTKGIAYSLSPSHYSPRCVPCHKRFDLDRVNAAEVA